MRDGGPRFPMAPVLAHVQRMELPPPTRTARSAIYGTEDEVPLRKVSSLADVAELLTERARLHRRVIGRSPQRPKGIQFTHDAVRMWNHRGMASDVADAVATLLHLSPEDLWPDWHEAHDAHYGELVS